MHDYRAVISLNPEQRLLHQGPEVVRAFDITACTDTLRNLSYLATIVRDNPGAFCDTAIQMAVLIAVVERAISS